MKKMHHPVLHLIVCTCVVLSPLVSLAERPGGGGGGGGGAGDVSKIHYVADGMTYSMNADGSGKQLEATVALEGPLSARKYSGSRWQLSVGPTDDWFEIYDDLNGNGQYDPESELLRSFPGIEVFASRWTGTDWEVVQVTDVSRHGLRHLHYGSWDVNVAWSNDGQDSFLSVRLTGNDVDADGRYVDSTSKPQYIARIHISGADLDAFALASLDPLIRASDPEFEIAAADMTATIDNYLEVFTSHSWNPDGSKLVIGNSGPNANPDAALFVWDVETGNTQFLLYAFSQHENAWAPDGSRIMVRDGSDILLVNPNGTGLVTLLNGGTNAYYSHAFWSPDSKWIVYRKLTSTRSICKMPVGGGKEVNLTKDLRGIQQWPLGWTAN